MREVVRYLGLDISMNHGGAALLETEKGHASTKYLYFTDVAKDAKASNTGYLLRKRAAGEDRHQYGLCRLAQVREIVHDIICDCEPDFVSIEDYAHGKANQAHYLGEIGAVVRLACWDRNVPFRLHDPASLKLYATGKGNATKEEVLAARRARWQESEPDVGPRVQEDLADAYILARMLWDEHALRTGQLHTRDMGAESIRVFNRVTKSNPENLLARQWIQRLSPLAGALQSGT